MQVVLTNDGFHASKTVVICKGDVGVAYLNEIVAQKVGRRW